MHRPGFFLLSGCLALSQMAGTCIDTDPAVFVDATVDTPALTVSEAALGVTLDGSFLLVLHLGARASGSSQVSYGAFSIVDEAGNVIVDNVSVTPDQAAPVTVEPGGADTAVTFTVSTGTDLLPAEAFDQLCAGPVSVSGVINDSLETKPTPVESESFLVNGCE